MSRSSSVKRVAAVSAAVLATTLGAAGTASAEHSWGPYHWARTGNPATVNLADNVSASWQADLEGTAADWSRSDVIKTPVVTGTANPKTCKPTAGRVEVCNAKYGRNGWLGLAQIWLSGEHITQGTAKMNDTYFSMAAYNNPNERRHVMCQEVGHTFGLGHTSEDGTIDDTCMDYSTSPTSTEPNQHDYDQLATIYTHLDDETTVAAGASSSPSAAGLDNAGWGRLVERSSDGTHRVYVRDLGSGQKVVTFVTGVR